VLQEQRQPVWVQIVVSGSLHTASQLGYSEREMFFLPLYCLCSPNPSFSQILHFSPKHGLGKAVSVLNPAPSETEEGLCFLLSCCCTWSYEVHRSGSCSFRLVFLFLGAQCCCLIPSGPAWLHNFAAHIFLCLLPAGTWKAIICFCPLSAYKPHAFLPPTVDCF